MKKIYLSGKHGDGKYAVVDNEDYERLSKYSWSFHPITGYPQRSYKHKKKTKTQFLHKLVLNNTNSQHIDHINGKKLDNRKSNLRPCTASQNHQNIKKCKGKSGYKGVYYHENANRNKKYQAYITLNYKRKTLGWFYTAEEAAIAYNTAAKKMFKEFASINNVQKIHQQET